MGNDDNRERAVETVKQQESQETFQALLLKAMNDDYKPTEQQVDRMMDLQEKGMDYTHNERKSILSRDIIRLVIIFLIILFLCFLIGIVVFQVPEYADVAITAVISVITGGFGGYGLGKAQSLND